MTSIVIPCHRAETTIVHTLAAVERSSFSPDEVICVIDGSPDRTADAVVEYARHSRLTVRCLNQSRRGAASARNAGWSAAAGATIVFLDADVVVATDTLGALVERIDHGDCCATVAMYSNVSVRRGILSQFQACLAHSVFQSIDPDDSPYFGTQCAAIKRSTLVELGGFDQTYRSASVEDFELGVRLRQRGHRICIARDATIFHNHAYKLSGFIRNYYVKARDLSVLMRRSPSSGLERDGYTTLSNVAALGMLIVAIASLPLAAYGGSTYLSIAVATPFALGALWRDFLRIAAARHGGARTITFVGLRALVTMVAAAGVLTGSVRSARWDVVGANDPSLAG